MAKLKVYLTAETKKFQRGLRRADRMVARLSRRVKRYGAIAGAAFAAAGAYSVRSYAKQEEAVEGLRAALDAFGYSAVRLMPSMTKFAAEMQKQTVFGDEEVLTLMKMITNLGIMPDKLEEATKGTIGLSRALGLSQDAAARYIALAMQGDYQVLQRYIPALKLASTEAEKMRIVQELMARGFKQAQEETKTSIGQWKQLKNALGDVSEGFGAIIVKTVTLGEESGNLTNYLLKLSATLMDSSDEWAYGFRRVWIEIKYGFLSTYAAVSTNLKNIGTFVKRLSTNFYNVAKALWEYAKDVFKNWRKLAGPAFTIIVDNLINKFRFGWDAIYSMGTKTYEALELAAKGQFKAAGEVAEEVYSAVPTAIRQMVEQDRESLRKWKKEAEAVGVVLQKPEWLTLFDERLYKDQEAEVQKVQASRLRELAELEESLRKRVAKRVDDYRSALEKRQGKDAGRPAGAVYIGVTQALNAAVASLGQKAERVSLMRRDISDELLRVGGYSAGAREVQTREQEILSEQLAVQRRMLQALRTGQPGFA